MITDLSVDEDLFPYPLSLTKWEGGVAKRGELLGAYPGHEIFRKKNLTFLVF